jgi:hypothetical protein
MDFDNLKELIENLQVEEEIKGFHEESFLELYDEFEVEKKEEDFTPTSIINSNENHDQKEEDIEPDEEVQEEEEGWRSRIEVYQPEEEEEEVEETYEAPPPLVSPPLMMSMEKREYPLEKDGYLFLKNVFHPEIIDRLNYEIQGFMNEEGIYSHLQKRQDVSQSRYFVNNTYGALKNFYQLQHYYVPVIDNRGTYNRITDVGVIDFYNVDRLFPQIRTFFELDVILMILLKTTGIEWKLNRINLQYYINVINPNAFHYDNGNERHIKVTIYLNDIVDEYSGPIAYMEGSHLNKRGMKASHTKVFTGRKGDVLISYQNGYHRRLPQRIQSTNGFLTFHFTTKSERQKYFPPELRL